MHSLQSVPEIKWMVFWTLGKTVVWGPLDVHAAWLFRTLSFFLFLLVLSHVIATCAYVCEGPNIHNQGNSVPLYMFNRREAKSPIQLQLWRFHSVMYGKYGASHQSTIKHIKASHQSTIKHTGSVQGLTCHMLCVTCDADHKIKKGKNVLTRNLYLFVTAVQISFGMSPMCLFCLPLCTVLFFFPQPKIISLFFCRHFEGFAVLFCFSFQVPEWCEPAGVFCQWQQQRQRQRCWGQQDRDQPGHATLTCGMKRFAFFVFMTSPRVFWFLHPLLLFTLLFPP